jgi:hypothetical protein
VHHVQSEILEYYAMHTPNVIWSKQIKSSDYYMCTTILADLCYVHTRLPTRFQDFFLDAHKKGTWKVQRFPL